MTPDTLLLKMPRQSQLVHSHPCVRRFSYSPGNAAFEAGTWRAGIVVADDSVISFYLFVSPRGRCSCLLEGLLASICIHIRKLELLPAPGASSFRTRRRGSNSFRAPHRSHATVGRDKDNSVGRRQMTGSVGLPDVAYTGLAPNESPPIRHLLLLPPS
jgi:hypothetical protein